MIKTRRFSGPSLTPMIDVVFLLLLFFLLSSQLKTQATIEVDIAGTSTAQSDADIQLIELGKVVRLNDQEVSIEALLAQLYALDRQKTSLAIRSDVETSFGEVISVVDKLKEAGFENIILVEKTNEN